MVVYLLERVTLHRDYIDPVFGLSCVHSNYEDRENEVHIAETVTEEDLLNRRLDAIQ